MDPDGRGKETHAERACDPQLPAWVHCLGGGSQGQPRQHRRLFCGGDGSLRAWNVLTRVSERREPKQSAKRPFESVLNTKLTENVSQRLHVARQGALGATSSASPRAYTGGKIEF